MPTVTAGKEHSFAHIFVVCADAFVNDLLANQGQAAALIAKMEELAGFRDPYASLAVSLRVSVCSSACFSCSVLGSVRALASRVQRALFAVAVKHTQMLSAAVAGVFRSVSLSVFHSLVCGLQLLPPFKQHRNAHSTSSQASGSKRMKYTQHSTDTKHRATM